MGRGDDTLVKTGKGFQESLDRANQQFEAQLTKLELGKEQIEHQNLVELEQSLQRVNEAIQHPEAFGVIHLKAVGEISMFAITSSMDSQYDLGILPILLERKKLILDRIRQLKGNQKIEDIKDLIKQVPDIEVKAKLEKQLEDLKNESARLNQQAKEVEQARMLEQLNAQEKLRRLEQEIFERKTKTWQSFFRRDFIATIVGSLLLIILTVAQITAMFRAVQTSEIVNNAFLIILGYFFGHTVSRATRDDEK